MNYTPEQQQAIDHRQGNLQILACAGSGKTQVISRRIAELVGEGIPKGAIVAFTFTDRAANELKARIRTHLEETLPTDPAVGDMYIGTIHSFCLQMLKELDPQFRRFEVMDEARQAALVMSNYHHFPDSNAGIGLNLLRVRTQSKGYWDTIRTFMTTVSVAHQKAISLDPLDDADLSECINRYRDLAYGYPNYFFDFDHIIARFLAELKNRPEALSILRHRFQYLVIDEYQDIDDRQEELIALISNHGLDVHVTVVGDDDQAIYGWRGARIDNILSFSQRYSNVTQIKLTHNFRSTHAIVEIADSAVRKIPTTRRLPKKMEARHWDASSNSFIETMALPRDVRVRSLPSEEDEAQWIANRIRELRGVIIEQPDGDSRAIDYADMAILLRSVKGSGKVILEVLQKQKIPVVIKGVGGLFDHDEVLLIYATFCLLARSEMVNNQAAATRRRNEAEIREFIRATIRRLSNETGDMPNANESQYLAWIAAKREQLDRRNLERERRGRLARRIYPQKIFQDMLEQLGSSAGVEPWPERVLYNLGRLSGLITDFEAVHQWITPSQLQALCFYLGGWAASQVDEGGLEESASPNAVQIMTVHAAKGLEWPVVFVPRVSSANFPSSLRNRGPATFLNAKVFNPADYAGGDEGERRLWYVALTRCQRFLNISSPNRKNKRPTSYFTDIKHDIVGRDDHVVELAKGEPVPPANAQLLPTTFTELNYYWRCPFEYQLRALMGFEPGVQESYGYGQQIHNILAEIHQSALQGQFMSADQVSRLIQQRFHLRYTRDGNDYKPLTRLRDAARQSIARFLNTYPDTTKFVLHAEKPFEFVDKGSGALISGVVDLIERVDNTQPESSARIPVAIVDFKAHRWGTIDQFVLRKSEVEAQLRLYAVAAGNSWGLDARTAYAHFLSPRPPTQDMVDQGVEERVTVDVSEEAREGVRLRVRDAVTEIQVAIQEGRFARRGVENGSCHKCDFRQICPGYKRWQERDTTTPRLGTPEEEQEKEMQFIAEDVDAGQTTQ